MGLDFFFRKGPVIISYSLPSKRQATTRYKEVSYTGASF